MQTFLRTVALLALGILGLFGALRGLVMVQRDDDRAEMEARVFLQRAAQALDEWQASNSGLYPDSLAALEIEHLGGGLGPANFYGGLLRAPLTEFGSAWKALRQGRLLDPWGRPWHYELGRDGRAVRLASFGPAPDGEGFAFELHARENELAYVHRGHHPLWP